MVGKEIHGEYLTTDRYRLSIFPVTASGLRQSHVAPGRVPTTNDFDVALGNRLPREEQVEGGGVAGCSGGYFGVTVAAPEDVGSL